MKKMDLCGCWELKRADWNEYITAEVPGTICTDLKRAGMLPDAYFGLNSRLYEKAAEYDYWYRRSFTLNAKDLEYKNITLNCDGIDTLCDIYINNKLLVSVDNMHRLWRLDAKALLSAGENTIEILIKSPLAYCRKKYAEKPIAQQNDSICRNGYTYIRKAHCMFGWDWGPVLPDGGIWRDIYLSMDNGIRILGVKTEQVHTDKGVTLIVIPELRDDLPDICMTAEFDGKKYEFSEGELEIDIESPKLWYPSGYGAQPLYELKITAYSPAGYDCCSCRIGLRKLELVTDNDRFGRSMYFRVNGIPIFAKGANYVIEDSLLSGYSRAHTERLLLDAKNANHNIVRVWGGALYPPDYFYDICDELGLMVWQDLMFACAHYPDTEEFYKSIAAETRDNVRRIRNHACIVLWCGNNECEAAVKDWWNLPQEELDAYLYQYNTLLKNVVLSEDSTRSYVPSSPTSNGDFKDIGSENMGDAHYWDVWFSQQPVSDYLKYHFRFLSEFGFQSFPCIETINEFTSEEDRNIFSRVMEHHQRDGAANGKILLYLSREFKYPKDLDSLAYVSQIMQSEAVAAGAEHMRRNRNDFRCMGAIYWQLNDCWPVASWSGIDYYGRWKMLHYRSRIFFDDVLVSAYHDIQKNRAVVVLVNDKTECVEKTIYYAVKTQDGRIMKSERKKVLAEPLAATEVFNLDISDADVYNEYFEYGDECEPKALLLCPNKHFNYKAPEISYKIGYTDDTSSVTITAKSLANYVELKADNNNVIFSDNYFALPAGATKIITCPGRIGQISVRSIADTY